MEVNDVLKFDPEFCTNSSNYLHGFVVIFSLVYYSFQGHDSKRK